MYAYIEGTITEIKPSYVVIEAYSVGYFILVPNPYSYHVGERLRVYTHHYVREDINHLYGFRSLASKELFKTIQKKCLL